MASQNVDLYSKRNQNTFEALKKSPSHSSVSLYKDKVASDHSLSFENSGTHQVKKPFFSKFPIPSER
jgi:hypothetical protein